MAPTISKIKYEWGINDETLLSFCKLQLSHCCCNLLQVKGEKISQVKPFSTS